MQRVYDFLIGIRNILNFFRDSVFGPIKLLQPFFKKDVYFFRDTECPYTELIDAYSLFKYMHSKGFECYYILRQNHPMCEHITALYPKNVIVLNNNVKMSNLHVCHFAKFLRLKIFFSAWGYGFVVPSLHQFLYNNKYIDYIFLQHGVILLKSFIFELYDNRVFNKILISNDYEKEIVKKHMGYNEQDIIKATVPRFNRLTQTKQRQKTKNIMLFFTWRLSFSDLDFSKSLYFKRLNSLLNNKRLHSLLDENNVMLNLGLHHALLSKNKNNELFIGKNFKIINSLEISKYIEKADMLLTDYSSVWADFFFQQKPVVFYRLDYGDDMLIEKDKEDAEFAKRSDKLLFNVCYDENKVVDLIEKYVKNDFELESAKKEITDKFFYTKENICQKIVDELALEVKVGG